MCTDKNNDKNKMNLHPLYLPLQFQFSYLPSFTHVPCKIAI